MKKNPTASDMGKVGGPARAKALTAERRQEIARKAAKARWGNGTDPVATALEPVSTARRPVSNNKKGKK